MLRTTGARNGPLALGLVCVACGILGVVAGVLGDYIS
jgi:hypothetical protein